MDENMINKMLLNEVIMIKMILYIIFKNNFLYDFLDL